MTIVPISDSTTRPLSLYVVLLESSIESANVVDPPTTTSIPLPTNSDTHYKALHTSPIGTLYYTPILVEVQTFFPWWKHIGTGQYSFSPPAIQQRQDKDLS
ncbi:hypothetical protein PVK06_007902 [Gossypium arboreum]|uniref:Uncharacterized protein n=1 Tax=Gossypium arboreum TaxID=29729 RepID=A0ABR0QJT1_GOSAR|nr:hypothetical protein PVK06_007902 [Gossypium arboreum]